jgi:hypothetical protein
MLREYTKSLEVVVTIMTNVETVIRTSAKAERNRLINNWNDYCDSVHTYLESMAEEDGPQDTYQTIYDLYSENKVIFDRMYKDLNDLLDNKKKVTTKDKHKKFLDKLDKKEEADRANKDRDISNCTTREVNDIVQSSYVKVVEVVNWLTDYANHVLTPKVNLTDIQVIEVTNKINESLAIAKRKEKMLNDYIIKQDKNHCEISAHVKVLIASANEIMRKVLCIRDAGDGARVRFDNIVPQSNSQATSRTSDFFRNDSHASTNTIPQGSVATVRIPSGIFRSDSVQTIAGPQGMSALALAQAQGLPTHIPQSQQQFTNAQLISMGCSANINGSLLVDPIQQRERTLRPRQEPNQGELGSFNALPGALTTENPYATNNPPLCISDSVTRLLRSNPVQETNWDDISTGKMDLFFWNPCVQRVKEDLTIPNKFSGVDLSLWMEFKAIVHTNINLKQYMNWGEKCTQLSRYLTKPAMDHCDFTDRSRLGYIMNLKILEREYGGYKRQESALYMMLANSPKMDNLKPETLHEPRMILRKIIKVVTQEGHTQSSAEDLFFDRAPWETWARQSFEAYTLARGESGETAELFDTWASSCQRFHAQRITRTNLSKIIGPETVLAITDATTTTPAPVATTTAACLNIVDQGHYQSDEDDGVFHDYGDYACLATFAKTRPPPKCYDCGLDHTVRMCPRSNARTPEDKAKKGHEWGLCPKCCGGKHKAVPCRTTKVCDLCGTLTNHHTMLHGAFIKDLSKVGNNPQDRFKHNNYNNILSNHSCNNQCNNSLINSICNSIPSNSHTNNNTNRLPTHKLRG